MFEPVTLIASIWMGLPSFSSSTGGVVGATGWAAKGAVNKSPSEIRRTEDPRAEIPRTQVGVNVIDSLG
jgi:hypothetical protein